MIIRLFYQCGIFFHGIRTTTVSVLNFSASFPRHGSLDLEELNKCTSFNEENLSPSNIILSKICFNPRQQFCDICPVAFVLPYTRAACTFSAHATFSSLFAFKSPRPLGISLLWFACASIVVTTIRHRDINSILLASGCWLKSSLFYRLRRLSLMASESERRQVQGGTLDVI